MLLQLDFMNCVKISTRFPFIQNCLSIEKLDKEYHHLEKHKNGNLESSSLKEQNAFISPFASRPPCVSKELAGAVVLLLSTTLLFLLTSQCLYSYSGCFIPCLSFLL